MRYKKTKHEVIWSEVLYNMVTKDKIYYEDSLFWRITDEGIPQYTTGHEDDEWETSQRSFEDFSCCNWYEAAIVIKRTVKKKGK